MNNPESYPGCPLSGRPAISFVQGFSVKALAHAWKIACGAEVQNLFGNKTHVSLYESDTGLMFFHPAPEGDREFYEKFYKTHKVLKHMGNFPLERKEYLEAARFVGPGDKVLDVGCGNAQFFSHIRHANYTGLDLYSPVSEQNPRVLCESVELHEKNFAGYYDVVTAFQVIEHVSEPLEFCRKLYELLKPGGILILSAPLHPSPQTDIPNYLLNFPPHHLTWWTSSAFKALAGELSIKAISIAELPYSPHEALAYWMHHFSMKKVSTQQPTRYFSHRWSIYLNLLLSYFLAIPAAWLCPKPNKALPTNVMMIAAKGK